MAYQKIDGVLVWGKPDEGALAQAKTCAETGNVVQTLLMADHQKGYSQPIGGSCFDRLSLPFRRKRLMEPRNSPFAVLLLYLEESLELSKADGSFFYSPTGRHEVPSDWERRRPEGKFIF